MGESQLVLYDALNSPAGRRVRMTLIEKGLGAEIRWLNLALMEQKSAGYLRLNPSGLVPTLLHGQRVVFESNLICEYLDMHWPLPRLVPADSWAQFEMRMWLAFEQEWAKPFRDAIYFTYARTRLHASGISAEELPARIRQHTANPAYAHIAQALLTKPADPQQLRDCIDILMERLSWMEQRLADGRHWLLGDDFSLADIALAPRLDMFPFIGVADMPARFPRIGAFLQRVRERPSWPGSALAPTPGSTTTFLSASVS